MIDGGGLFAFSFNAYAAFTVEPIDTIADAAGQIPCEVATWLLPGLFIRIERPRAILVKCLE